MSSAETGAKEAKAGSAPSGSAPHNGWAAFIFFVVLVLSIIYAARAHSSRISSYLCTRETLAEFTEARDLDGLARIADACAGSRIGEEARSTMWDWRAARRQAYDRRQGACSTWESRKALEDGYECSAPWARGETPISYKDWEWRGPRREPGYERHKGALFDGKFVAQVYNGVSREGAEDYRENMRRRHSDLVAGLTVAIEDAGRPYGGEHKVLIGPLRNKQEADMLCSELKRRNVDCFAKPTAEALY